MCPQTDLDKMLDNKISFPLGEFYMLCIHVVHVPCSKLHINTKHAKWQIYKPKWELRAIGLYTSTNYVCFHVMFFYTNHGEAILIAVGVLLVTWCVLNNNY